jgi:hypothetical protein
MSGQIARFEHAPESLQRHAQMVPHEHRVEPLVDGCTRPPKLRSTRNWGDVLDQSKQLVASDDFVPDFHGSLQRDDAAAQIHVPLAHGHRCREPVALVQGAVGNIRTASPTLHHDGALSRSTSTGNTRCGSSATCATATASSSLSGTRNVVVGDDEHRAR